MDKKKLGLIIGAVVAVLALVGGAFALLNRGGGDTTDTATTPASGTTSPGAGGSSPRQQALRGRNKTGADGISSTAAGVPPAGTGKTDAPVNNKDPFAPKTSAAATAANGTAKPGAPGAVGTKPGGPSAIKTRPDPFFVTWKRPPPEPYVFDEVQPIRLASAGVQAPPARPIDVREVPNRRVSGIMSGDGVFAILEQNGNSEIVKPGSQTNDGYRVVSINDDSVKLQRREGSAIFTQIVPLSDESTGVAAARPGGGFVPPGGGNIVPRPRGAGGAGGGGRRGGGGGGRGDN